MSPKSKKSVDAETLPKYSSPTNLGIVTSSTLQGYAQNITIDKLTKMYLRQGFCYRIVNKRANDMFDAGFEIVNNDPLARETETLFKELDFMKELKQVQKYGFLHGCGFLLIGWKDSAELEEEPQNVTGVDYVIPISLNKIKRVVLDENKDSPMYGNIIALEFTQKKASGGAYETKRIHYKRFIVLNYDTFDNNPLGYSQVAPAYNYLETLENFLWSAGQAYYRYGSPLHVLKIEGATTDKLAEFDKQMPDMNSMSRILLNERYDLQSLQQTPTDPKPFFEVNLTAVCAVLGIPRQIVEGTNAGAITGSETNLRDYYSDIAQEQVLVIEERIREFLEACQEYGVIKNKGEFIIDWNPQFEQTELEKAQTMKTWAEAYQAMLIAGVPQETIDENIPLLSADAIFPITNATLIERKGIKREGELNFLENKILRTLRAIFDPKQSTKLVPDSSPSLLARIKDMIFRKDAEPITPEDEEGIRDEIDNWIGKNEVRIKAAMPQIITAQMRAGGIDIENPDYDTLYRRIYQNNFNFINGFNQDLRKDLSGVLSNALQNNWSKGMLETEFNRVMSDMTNARLQAIVRTETNRAVNDVENQLARLDGMRWKTWVTMGDDKVRDSHARHEMETIPINEPFDIDGSPTMYPPADVNSYDEETEIYTTNGWENVSELKEGSKCISLNPDNFDLEYVDVVKTYQHTPDKMVHFTTHNLDMMVTPDHNVFYQTDWKAKNNGNWQFVKAKDLIGKVSGRFYRSSKWVGTYPMGLKLGDFDVTPEQYAEFMALYLSDGNIVKERGRVDISKTREKYPEDWELLNDLLTEIGFTYNYNGEKFAIHHKALADQLEIFGKCNEKYIPDEIKNATPDVIRVFLNAYTRGDGYVTPPSTINGYMNESRNQYFTTSKRLADDIGELILKIGKRPSFHLRPDKGKVVKHHNGEYAGNFDLWIIYECSSQHAYIGRMEINEVPYNGTAYCVDLEKYHTLLTRRNGKVVWSGNCRCWLEYS